MNGAAGKRQLNLGGGLNPRPFPGAGGVFAVRCSVLCTLNVVVSIELQYCQRKRSFGWMVVAGF